MAESEPPLYFIEKYEFKAIRADVRSLQKMGLSFSAKESTYRQQGFEEASRRAARVHWILADALNVMMKGPDLSGDGRPFL